MTGYIDNQPGLRDQYGLNTSYWSFIDRAPQTYFASALGPNPEHVSVTAAYPGYSGWGTAGGADRNGQNNCSQPTGGTAGATFATEWARALNVDPRIATVTGFNQWIVPIGFQSDQFTPSCSNDIEPSTVYNAFYINQAAGSNYVPLFGDFNRDGVADIGLRDQNNGVFYFKMGPNFGSNQSTYAWAVGSNYRALTGDFDGDGYWDVGLADSNNGTVYLKHGPTYSDQQTFGWATGGNYQVTSGDLR